MVPDMAQGKQYERTVAMIDISADNSYILDVFRVIGGREHTWLMHGSFGEMTTIGLELKPGMGYGGETIMRNFQIDEKSAKVWSADWKIRDYYKLLKRDRDIHLRYTGVTEGCEVRTCEEWVTLDGYNTINEEWIPGIMVGRKTEGVEELASTFAGVIEPYEGRPEIIGIKRLKAVCIGEDRAFPGDIALEVTLRNGDRDLLISVDIEGHNGSKPLNDIRVDENGWKVHTDCELLMARKHDGYVKTVMCKGSFAIIDDLDREIDITLSYMLGLRKFVEMLRNGKLPMPLELLYKPVELLNAVVNSYRTGKEIFLKK